MAEKSELEKSIQTLGKAIDLLDKDGGFASISFDLLSLKEQLETGLTQRKTRESALAEMAKLDAESGYI